MPEGSFLNPSRIVSMLGIGEGMTVAEFGSGTGMFSLACAASVGKEGKVYAVDVQKDALDALQSKARMEGVFNLQTLWADLERAGSTKLSDATVDAVLVPNMLFQSQKKADILREARRVVKEGGVVVVIDWLPEKAIFGKAMGWPVSPDEMRVFGEEAGLSFQNRLETGSAYHYGMLFKK